MAEIYNKEVLKTTNTKIVYDFERQFRVSLEKNVELGKNAWQMSLVKSSGGAASTKKSISESDMQRWEALNKYFRNQYPTHTLQMKEGLIMVNKVVVENAESFFAKNNNQISSLLKGVCSKLNG
jgi:hypothetical protein